MSRPGNVSRVTLYFRTVFVEAIAADVLKHLAGSLRIMNAGEARSCQRVRQLFS
jgi:hypothetical protein